MNHENTKQIIKELLRLMGVGFEDVSIAEADNRTAFVIKSPDSRILIGTHGATIAALNHLVKRIVGKKSDSDSDSAEVKTDFYVDVNDYHDKLMQEIKNKAQILAGRARSFKTNVEMDPMSSFERMIVHTLFQDAPDIKTESVGTGSKRHIVIKYVEAVDGGVL